MQKKSYCAIHNVDPSLNLGDITKVNEKEIDDFNMMTWGSPCQDFSIAGLKAGSIWSCKECGYEYNPITINYEDREYCPSCTSIEINKTRSSLLVEGLRILHEKRPNISIFENVDNIIGNANRETFDRFIKELNELGYNNYFQVVNSLDFDIPQNRKRVIIVSILSECDNGKFKFPRPLESTRTLSDILEDEVDERYFIHKVLNPRKTKNYLQYDNSGKGYNSQASRLYYTNKYMCALPKCNSGDKTQILISENPLIARRTTPKECWRLMGFDDSDYKKALSVINTTGKLYNQAGNSIVVDVLYYIYLELYKAMPYLFDDLRLSSFFSGIGAFEKALDKLYENI